MTETEFNILCIACFVITVTGVAIGFTYFMKWRKRVQTTPVTREDLEARAAAIDARYRAKHPEMDEDFEGPTLE